MVTFAMQGHMEFTAASALNDAPERLRGKTVRQSNVDMSKKVQANRW